ncbi:MAG: M23 family metallopeptidase [Actinomycetia bacterium]|nr:M23 family metallopeptidase [Actinomycetes bacterium]
MINFIVTSALLWLSPVTQPLAQPSQVPNLTWPTSAHVIRDFAPPWPDWLPGHRGLDLAASKGERVRTPQRGVLVWKGRPGGTPTVVVQHGAARASYQPVSTDLPLFTALAPAQAIGIVRQGTGHCVACLHWGLRIGERYLDPRLLLGDASARLVAPAVASR